MLLHGARTNRYNCNSSIGRPQPPVSEQGLKQKVIEPCKFGDIVHLATRVGLIVAKSLPVCPYLG